MTSYSIKRSFHVTAPTPQRNPEEKPSADQLLTTTRNRLVQLVFTADIKINRLRWAGHVIRLEEQNPARRVLVAVVEGRRQRGRTKLRWENGVREDARMLAERNWRNAARAEASKERLGSKWAVVNDDDVYRRFR
jgi:hypothetical protein